MYGIFSFTILSRKTTSEGWILKIGGTTSKIEIFRKVLLFNGVILITTIAEPSEVMSLVKIDLDIVILVDFGRLVSVDDACP